MLKVAKKAKGLHHYDVVHTSNIGRLSYRCLQLILVLLTAILSIYFWSWTLPRIEITHLCFRLIRDTNEAIRILDDMDSDFESDTETSESDDEGSADDLQHHQLGIIH